MQKAKVKSLVLAGGLGLRLRSHVADRPKVMAPVAGKPFIEYLLRSLKKRGFLNIILSVGYMKESIIEYFGDGSNFGLKIEYVTEEKPLGTGGAIKNAQQLIKDTFLVLNGDTYLDIDYNELLGFHTDKQSLVTMALIEAKDSSRYGLVELGQNNRITGFQEKAAMKQQSLINAGVYVMEPAVFSHLNSTLLSFEQQALPQMIKSNVPIFGLVMNSFFVDIGTPEGYKAAQKYFEDKIADKK